MCKHEDCSGVDHDVPQRVANANPCPSYCNSLSLSHAGGICLLAASAAMVTTDARLTRLAVDGRLKTDVEFARRSLLALSNGVTALWAQGASKTEIKAVEHFLLAATLRALVRDKRTYTSRRSQ